MNQIPLIQNPFKRQRSGKNSIDDLSGRDEADHLYDLMNNNKNFGYTGAINPVLHYPTGNSITNALLPQGMQHGGSSMNPPRKSPRQQMSLRSLGPDNMMDNASQPSMRSKSSNSQIIINNSNV